MTFLQSKLPPRAPVGPFGRGVEPSAAELAQFHRYVDAVEDPKILLAQAAKGVLTPETIEAVQTVYPALFAKIQTTILDKISSYRGVVPYQQRLTISALLGGQDLDGTMNPAMIAATQMIFGVEKQQAAQQPKAIKGDGASRALTATQRTAQR
jgi:hypothetical protein